jgi:hypothetical protein
MAQEIILFAPNTSDTAAISATTNSASAALTGSGNSVRVFVTGTGQAFIQFGDSNVTATTSKMPVAAAIESFGLPDGVTHIAAITASGTATVYATRGKGI